MVQEAEAQRERIETLKDEIGVYLHGNPTRQVVDWLAYKQFQTCGKDGGDPVEVAREVLAVFIEDYPQNPEIDRLPDPEKIPAVVREGLRGQNVKVFADHVFKHYTSKIRILE